MAGRIERRIVTDGTVFRIELRGLSESSAFPDGPWLQDESQQYASLADAIAALQDMNTRDGVVWTEAPQSPNALPVTSVVTLAPPSIAPDPS